MKKASNLIVVAIVLLSLLTGCSNKGDPAGNKKGDGNLSVNNSGISQVDVSKIKNITSFYNGLAFVQYQDDEKTYCIDKTGNHLFALEDCNLYNFVAFNDNIAMIENENVICDKQGKLYTAENFSASSIVFNNDNYQQAFLDGYIILERREESYTGTKIEMSIMNSDFTTLVPFSAELAETINGLDGIDYYDGYFYDDDTILDLRTGTKFSDRTQMKVSALLLSYWADGSYNSRYKHLQWGDIYNELTGKIVAKVKEHEAISQIIFKGNLGLATYRSDNGMWFNIIDQNGVAKFEPIKAESAEIEFDGETIITYARDTIEKDGTTVAGLSIKSYDVLGNALGEIFLDSWSFGGGISINDGVIQIYNMDTDGYTLYNASLETLF